MRILRPKMTNRLLIVLISLMALSNSMHTLAQSPDLVFESAMKRHLSEQKDFANYLQDISDRTWLKEGSGQEFLSLFLADQSGADHGIVLCLPGAGHLPTEPQYLEYLRSHLPQHGWATMGISLFNDNLLNQLLFNGSFTFRPVDTGANNSSNTVQADEKVQKLSETFQNRLALAIAEAEKKKPRYLVVLATGISGLWLYEALEKGAIPPTSLTSIIMIDGFQPQTYQMTNLIQLSISTPTPLLDITLKNPLGIEQAQFRHIRSQQQQREDYRLLELNVYRSEPTQKRLLLKNVVGWLKQFLKKE